MSDLYVKQSEVKEFRDRLDAFNKSETRFFFLFLHYLSIDFSFKKEFDGCVFNPPKTILNEMCKFSYVINLKGYLDFAARLTNQDSDELKKVWDYFLENKGELKKLLKVLMGGKGEFEGEIGIFDAGGQLQMTFVTNRGNFFYNNILLDLICYYNKEFSINKFRDEKEGAMNAPLPSRIEKKNIIKLIPINNKEDMFYQYLPTIKDTILRNTKYKSQ